MKNLKENPQNNQKDVIGIVNAHNKRAISLKNKYTINQKLNVVREVNLTSIYATANKYGIYRASIRDWIK